MKVYVTARNEEGIEELLDQCVEDDHGNWVLDIPNETDEMFEMLGPFGRFRIIAPCSPQGLFAVHFENEED